MIDTPSGIRFDASNVDPDVPVAEVEVTTRYQEARAAMAVVATLREHGVPVRDIVVVARDLDAYEEPLTRAAIRQGVTPVFWTQIDLVETELYRLIVSLCELFGDAEPDSEVLLRPLELGWTPNEATDEWPLPAEMLAETSHRLPGDSRPIHAWNSLLDEARWTDRRVSEYVEWVANTPEPTPTTVAAVLGGVVESYRKAVLPDRQAADSPALLETETAARATVRMETLVEQVESKYNQRLSDGWTNESWTAVQGMCESLARQRPGRREHANARALDILEANDIWAREIPYVVIVGLVDGEWPIRTESTIPPELQHTILVGDGPAGRLAPRTAWHGGRDRDQFCDTIAAATRGIIATRHALDVDENRQFRSPLLDHLDTELIDRAARQQLLSTDRALPKQIEPMLPDDGSEISGSDFDE
jgi:ATP-dependent helicase/nuclease subunit B